MTYEEAKKQCDVLNAQLTTIDKKYKKWVINDDGDNNYSVVLQYRDVIVKGKRGKGILLILLSYILWKNL